MRDDGDDGKGLVSSGLLVASVALILLAGMMLKAAPRDRASEPATPLPQAPALGASITPEVAAPAAPAQVAPAAPDPVAALAPLTPVEAEHAPTAIPTTSADPALTKLAARAAADSGRIAKVHGAWTAQLMVACKPETVDHLLAQSAGSTKLYVLPVRHRDEACFRVCWGAYASAKDAATAADLPRTLRGKEKAGAVEIAKVLP
jgi:hypothetical protein